MTVQPPPTSPRYDHFRLLGHGGNAELFKAWDRYERRLVVYKRYAPEHGDLGIREGELLARYRHPGIAAWLDHGWEPGLERSFLVMEYLDGVDLVQACGDRSLVERLELFRQLCQILQFLHFHGLVHRDIKSSNILVVGDSVRLIDFGAANEVGYDTCFQGTLHYTAPELFFKLGVDRSADLYSLGVLLYRVFCGSYPRHATDLQGWRNLHESRPDVRIHPDMPLSDDFKEMLGALLGYSPEDRGSIDELLRLLEVELSLHEDACPHPTAENDPLVLADLLEGWVDTALQAALAWLRTRLGETPEGLYQLHFTNADPHAADRGGQQLAQVLRRMLPLVVLPASIPLDELYGVLRDHPPYCFLLAPHSGTTHLFKGLYAPNNALSLEGRPLILCTQGGPLASSTIAPSPDRVYEVVLPRLGTETFPGLIERFFQPPVTHYLQHRLREQVVHDHAHFQSFLMQELRQGHLFLTSRGWRLAPDIIVREDPAEPTVLEPPRSDRPAPKKATPATVARLLRDTEALHHVLERHWELGEYPSIEHLLAALEPQTTHPQQRLLAELYRSRLEAHAGNIGGALLRLRGLEGILSQQPPLPPLLNADLRLHEATLLTKSGEFLRSNEVLERLVADTDLSRIPLVLTSTLTKMAINRSKLGDYRGALGLYHDLLEAKRAGNDDTGLAALQLNIGVCHHLMQDHDQALAHYRKAARQALVNNDGKRYTLAVFNEADLLLDRKDHPRAREAFLKAAKHARRIDYSAVLQRAELNLLYLDAMLGDQTGKALQTLGDLSETYAKADNAENQILANVLIGRLHLAKGDHPKAREHLESALELALRIKHQRMIKELDHLLYELGPASSSCSQTAPTSPLHEDVYSHLERLLRQTSSPAELFRQSGSELLRWLGQRHDLVGAVLVLKLEQGGYELLTLDGKGTPVREFSENLVPEELLETPSGTVLASTSIPFARLSVSPLPVSNRGPRFALWLDEKGTFGLLAPILPGSTEQWAGLERYLELLRTLLSRTAPVLPPPGQDKLLGTVSRRAILPQELARSVTFSLVDRILERQPLQRTSLSPLGYLIGTSKALADLYDQVEAVARTPVSVLIEGESGVGKEVLVRTLHELGEHPERPLVVQNCGAIPLELAESVFFGHEKGAFTGAHERRIGVIQQSQGGTLFLDEIGDLPSSIQVALLRVLQERKIRPVGATRELEVSFRLVAATNKPLHEEVAQGRFREDLYYRLDVVHLHVPPLRERKEDLPLLMDYFLGIESQQLGKRRLELDRSAYQALLAHDWPGNIRELRNVVMRLLVFHSGTVGKKEVLTCLTRSRVAKPFTETHELSSATPPFSGEPPKIQDYLDRHERAFLVQALRYHDGNVKQCAEQIGLGRVTLYNRIKALGITREAYSGT